MRTTIAIEPLTPTLRALMAQASEEDGGHYAPLATHAFVRAGEVVGAAGLLTPCLTFWAHSKKLHARESFDVIERVKTASAAMRREYLVICCPDSPFYPMMEKLGHRRLGNTDIFQRA